MPRKILQICGLDEFLTWEHQIKHVSNKISSAIFALNQIKNILPLNIRKTIYNSLIHSHLSYGNITWGLGTCKALSSIRKLQKRAVRLVTNNSYKAHTDKIFGNLEILKFDDLVRYNSKTFMFKHANGLLPPSFDNMFERLQNARNENYKSNIAKFKLLETLPSVYLPKLWNSQSLEIKRVKSLSVYQNKIKKINFSEYNAFICRIQDCFACKK